MGHVPGMTIDLWQNLNSANDLHTGLVFYRFLDPAAEGTAQFQRLIQNRVRTVIPFIEDVHQRTQHQLQYLAGRSWAVRYFEARLATRLAVGLGIPSPVENGLAMDHTHGIPNIPGSGLKGLCLDWALEEEGLQSADPKITSIFGAQPPGAPDPDFKPRAGRAVFFDAFPVAQDKIPPLELDIMNPHYGPYYQSQGGSSPADYYNPNIIFFLTIKKDTVFRFALAVRPPYPGSETTEPTADVLAEDLERWLQNVLTLWGVGAKTSVGYGLFDGDGFAPVPCH